MKLENIIKNCGVTELLGSAAAEITSVTNDSRKAVPGCLFIAVNGCGNDGRAYIAAAAAAGASAIMFEKPEDPGSPEAMAIGSLQENVVRIIVEDSRKAVAAAADNFYGHPSGKLCLVGVTGTNGKTTVATLLYEMFRKLGHECGLMSTIANYIGPRRLETSNTTSDPVTVNSLLAEMVAAGCTHCFMEVSSIGVDQHRIDGLEFRAGIFTNLTHDHLDYHGTFAAYLRCKQMFFDQLPKSAYAITNIDDRNGRIMVQNTRAKVLTYSCRSLADHSCRIIEETIEGMLLNIDGTEVWTMLTGAHNAYNLLAIYTAATALGTPSDSALLAISGLKPVKGRLETIPGPGGINVVIDYAHTPDALENVLKTLKDVAPEKPLFCVFGCGGDRDRTKRPEMGAVAAKYADRIILTSDNSRSESTEEIMAEIRGGIPEKDLAKTLSISDRREAIRTAIMLAAGGATVLLAGKGHETYQIIGRQKSHFDEREIVEEIFKNLK